MSSIKLSQPRVLRTGSPLSLEAIQQYTPAVFAAGPHHERGPRYLYVPTIQPLTTLLDNGWGVYETSQQRSRKADRDPYTKHMLRMRKLADFDSKSWSGDGVPEVVLVNAHDGTAAYTGYVGYFRFICSNGMMVGNKLGGFTIRHMQGARTSADVLQAMELLTTKFPVMLNMVDTMRKYRLAREAQLELAETAVRLRYGSTVAPFQPEELLNVRREADAGDDAWHVLNRIQENVMQGGWETRSWAFGRRSAVRAVERVSAVTKINTGLWDHALELVEA